MIDWKEIECVLFDWVIAKLPDVDDKSIIFADQNLPQPPYPYLTFKRDSLIRSGSKDETRNSTDLSQPEGQEVTLETIGVREFTLTLNAFVDEDNGANDPNADAVYLLSLLQTSLSQQSTQEAFCLGGLSVVEGLAVIDLSQVVNGEFVSRASMDVRFRITFSCLETTGFIETVEIESVPCVPSGPDDVTGVAFEVRT